MKARGPVVVFGLLALLSATSIGRVHSHAISAKAGVSRRGLSGGRTTPTIVEYEGYPSETYVVRTEDGYILQIHRIPYGVRADGVSAADERPVVLLQHGLLSSSADWVLAKADRGLAFILADAGYDVWMGNYRGNTYSRNHERLDPEDTEFWDFSWDQMAKIDLPLIVNHVLNVTGQEKIFYIGHSMGTTTFMAMMHLHPEMQSRIRMASFLAPVAYVEHMKGPLYYISYFEDELSWALDLLGVGEFLPSNYIMNVLADLVCDNDSIQVVCSSIFFLLSGFDASQLDEDMLETIVLHTPAGTSTHTVVQYGQEVRSAKFQSFDRGSKRNLEEYGSVVPPVYSVANLTVPVGLYWGLNDWLAQPEDVIRLNSELPNLIANYEVPYAQWNHLDFLWGRDANTLVYPEVLKDMEKF